MVKSILALVNHAVPGCNRQLHPDIANGHGQQRDPDDWHDRPIWGEVLHDSTSANCWGTSSLEPWGESVLNESVLWMCCESAESVLWVCRVPCCYFKLMRHLIISNTIQWSRDICAKDITGHHQYEDIWLRSPARSKTEGRESTSPIHMPWTYSDNAFEYSPPQQVCIAYQK